MQDRNPGSSPSVFLVGMTGAAIGLAFGVLEAVATNQAARDALDMYVKLYGWSGSTGYGIGLAFVSLFVFPAYLILLLGLGGGALYAVGRRRGWRSLSPLLLAPVAGAIWLLPNLTPDAQIPIFRTVFVPGAAFAAVATIVFCIAATRALRQGEADG